jgi:hypothetical protein
VGFEGTGTVIKAESDSTEACHRMCHVGGARGLTQGRDKGVFKERSLSVLLAGWVGVGFCSSLLCFVV